MELYNVNTLPLSNDNILKIAQEKVLNGENLLTKEKIILGRDEVVKNINGYNLLPDHAYRAVNLETLKNYISTGFINGISDNDEYEEKIEDGKVFNNNKGVDWYLGGASLKYGEIILECPAYKDYFVLAYDNGTRMARNPLVRHIKSSGIKNPIPLNLITNIFINTKDINLLKEIKSELSKLENRQNITKF